MAGPAKCKANTGSSSNPRSSGKGALTPGGHCLDDVS